MASQIVYKIWLFLLLSCSLFASANLSLDFFKDKPRSNITDFYISQYLDQNITSNEANELIQYVKNMNLKLFYKFANKIDSFAFKRVEYCLRLKPKEYIGKSNSCVAMGLSPYKASELSPKELNQIAYFIEDNFPKKAAIYRILAKRDFYELTKSKEIFNEVFANVKTGFRQKYYNFALPKTFQTNQNILTILKDPKMDKAQLSLIDINSSKLSHKTNFYLALNALKHNRENLAIRYLKISFKKAYYRFDKDKTLFWIYLITKDKNILKTLTKSKDINIYSLYAHEKLNTYPNGIRSEIEPKKSFVDFNITDPYAWKALYKKSKTLKFKNYQEKRKWALEYNSNDTEPHVALLIYDYSKNIHYFLKPYFKYLKNLPKKRVALILAIAKQESRFIPTAVSYSYALGLMQFMPFLAKDIAKQINFKNFKYEDMFNPKIAYKFADIHLNYLEKYLYHPLFVAYAYNGGIGFTRRQVLQTNYFEKGKFEPFLSMELMPNEQAKKYGKKVLANYVIYANLLDLNITLTDLLKKLNDKKSCFQF